MWKIPGDDFTAAVTLNVTPGLFRFLRLWLKYLILFAIPEGMDLNIPCRSNRSRIKWCSGAAGRGLASQG